jgi:hypothetical protein
MQSSPCVRSARQCLDASYDQHLRDPAQTVLTGSTITYTWTAVQYTALQLGEVIDG